MGRITVIGVVLIVVVDAAVVSAIVRTEDPRVVVVILGRRPGLPYPTACFPLNNRPVTPAVGSPFLTKSRSLCRP